MSNQAGATGWPNAFSDTAAAIRSGIERGLHTCVQIYVSLDEYPVLNHAIGTATEDAVATADTIFLWRSAGKPLTAAGISRLAEDGLIFLDDTLGRHLPQAAGSPFAELTVQDCLTHSTGLPVLDTCWPDADWKTIIRDILHQDVRIALDRFAYQPQATWFLLGEVMRLRTDATTFAEALDWLVLTPAGLNHSRCGFDLRDATHLPFARMFEGRGKKRQPSTLSNTAAIRSASPGGNIRGPISDLGRFYEILLRGGALAGGGSFLSPASVRAMTTRHRVGQFDYGLQYKIDMGLGCLINSEQYGPAVPYGYGRAASINTFGHGGAQCSMGFCDPEHRLVVAWAANGLCGEPHHQRRNRLINEAVYSDLNLERS